MMMMLQEDNVQNPTVALVVVEAKNWVDANWRLNPSLEEVADKAQMSKFHFHRMFKRLAGKTLKNYVDEYRVDEAKKMLLRGVSIETIAEELKFAHQSHFTSRFKQLVGQTPRRWVIETRKAQMHVAA